MGGDALDDPGPDRLAHPSTGRDRSLDGDLAPPPQQASNRVPQKIALLHTHLAQRNRHGIALGDRLPDISLTDGDGREVALSGFRARPLLAVCIRYYG